MPAHSASTVKAVLALSTAAAAGGWEKWPEIILGESSSNPDVVTCVLEVSAGIGQASGIFNHSEAR